MLKNPQKLTESQMKIFTAIQEFIEMNGYSPTSRELGSILGISGPSVHEQLVRLEEKGFIRRQKKKARSIELLKVPETGAKKKVVKMVKVPVLGEIAAGEPLYAHENYEREILVDQSSIGQGKFFALKVKGESMIKARINNTDLVIVRQQPVAESGEIIAALVGDEATVKRLRIDKFGVFLDPENDLFFPIEVTLREDFKILGKVVSIVSVDVQ